MRRCPCENFLYGYKPRPQGAARAADSAARPPLTLTLPLRPARTPVGWREDVSRGRGLNRRKATGPRRLDTGTPRGGSIGLTGASWEARPIAGKRTAAAPV
jgi:hypothetical protein